MQYTTFLFFIFYQKNILSVGLNLLLDSYLFF
jgi:hypothetical protein